MLSKESMIIELPITDSTNNYAMRLINGNSAHHGLTIFADSQTAGKGQRGKTWLDAPGKSLIMSIVAVPTYALTDQFLLIAAVSSAIADYLQELNKYWAVNIKWMNDIIINDKKAGGILIENVIRGANWTYSVIGVGINLSQSDFPQELPNATSLFKASGTSYPIKLIKEGIRNAVMYALDNPPSKQELMSKYNNYLYKRNSVQSFLTATGRFEAKILETLTDGDLVTELNDGMTSRFKYGEIVWDWG
jgi:BirA family transcriptional regulator, biotin operon repressor / biotin---[acetyl-CoA-carboxylase] ligase